MRAAAFRNVFHNTIDIRAIASRAAIRLTRNRAARLRRKFFLSFLNFFALFHNADT
jgi:hypothetical protein